MIHLDKLEFNDPSEDGLHTCGANGKGGLISCRFLIQSIGENKRDINRRGMLYEKSHFDRGIAGIADNVIRLR